MKSNQAKMSKSIKLVLFKKLIISHKNVALVFQKKQKAAFNQSRMLSRIVVTY